MKVREKRYGGERETRVREKRDGGVYADGKDGKSQANADSLECVYA